MSSVQDPADRVLRSLIYDYLCKRGLNGAATALQAEAAAFGEDTSANLPVNVPQSFLFEWFGLFWDMYSARASEDRAERSLDARHNLANENGEQHSAGDDNIEQNEPFPSGLTDPAHLDAADHSKMSNGRRSFVCSDTEGARNNQERMRWPQGNAEKGIKASVDAVDGAANVQHTASGMPPGRQDGSASAMRAKQEPGMVDSNLKRGAGGTPSNDALGGKARASGKVQSGNAVGEGGGTEMSSSSLFSGGGRKRPSVNSNSGLRGRKRGALANLSGSQREQAERTARLSANGNAAEGLLNATTTNVAGGGAEHSALSGPQGGRPPSRGARNSRNASVAASALAIAQQQGPSGGGELDAAFGGVGGGGANNTGAHVSPESFMYTKDVRGGKGAVLAGSGGAGSNSGPTRNNDTFSPPHTTSPPAYGAAAAAGAGPKGALARPTAWNPAAAQRQKQAQQSANDPTEVNWGSEFGAPDVEEPSKSMAQQVLDGGPNSQRARGGQAFRGGSARGGRGGGGSSGGAARGGATNARRGGSTAAFGAQRGVRGSEEGIDRFDEDIAQSAFDSAGMLGTDAVGSGRNVDQKSAPRREQSQGSLFGDQPQNTTSQNRASGSAAMASTVGSTFGPPAGAGGGSNAANASPMASLRAGMSMNQVLFEDQQLLDILAGNANEYSPKIRVGGHLDSNSSLANIDRLLAGGGMPFGGSGGARDRARGGNGGPGGKGSTGGAAGGLGGGGGPSRMSDFMFLNPGGGLDVNDVLDSLGGGNPSSNMRAPDRGDGRHGAQGGKSGGPLNASGAGNSAKYH